VHHLFQSFHPVSARTPVHPVDLPDGETGEVHNALSDGTTHRGTRDGVVVCLTSAANVNSSANISGDKNSAKTITFISV
jgi:hypothetical protein